MAKSPLELTLLETKLSPPRAGQVEVPRAPVAEFNVPRTNKSFCVVASAGSGKSTFLRQLYDALESEGHRCGWLNLDTRDNAPTRLVPYLFNAVGRLLPGGDAGQAPVDFEYLGSLELAFSNLEVLVEQLGPNCVLFMDDFHFIKNPQVLEQMNYLLDACDVHLRLMLGGRELPLISPT
ncbi:AAA family ATPase [Leisingera sp. HS039]|nr:AAA family ATPase [Leisingera sp. HS039]MBQ4827634.1 AAA family ATPase [Leisingera sp. HS039]